VKVNVLFVCLGNICRSPTAHGVFLSKLEEARLGDVVNVDSCGTAAWHIGKSPDSRSTAAAARRGYDLSSLRARQLEQSDFDTFDYILVMDKENLANAKQLAPSGHKAYLDLFLAFNKLDDACEVPDPYYGGEAGFNYVLDLVESACDGLIEYIKNNDLN